MTITEVLHAAAMGDLTTEARLHERGEVVRYCAGRETVACCVLVDETGEDLWLTPYEGGWGAMSRDTVMLLEYLGHGTVVSLLSLVGRVVQV